MPYNVVYNKQLGRSIVYGMEGAKSVKSKLFSAIRTHRIKPFTEHLKEFMVEHGRFDEGVTRDDVEENLQMYLKRHSWVNQSDPVRHIVNYRCKLRWQVMHEFFANNQHHFIPHHFFKNGLITIDNKKDTREEKDMIDMFNTLIDAGAVYRGNGGQMAAWYPAVLCDLAVNNITYCGAHRVFPTEIVHHFIEKYDDPHSMTLWRNIFKILAQANPQPGSINHEQRKYIANQMFAHPKLASDLEMQAILLQNFV